MLNPLLHHLWIEEAAREHERAVRRAEVRLALEASRIQPPPEPVTLRLDTVQDDKALEDLATLAGRRTSPGRHVVAEVDGVIVAALPLLGGEPYADPFRRTAHLLPLLELRADQVTGPPPRRRSGLLRWSRA